MNNGAAILKANKSERIRAGNSDYNMFYFSYSSPNYSLPSYESKFESLISRTDGKPRSRAGIVKINEYLISRLVNI